MDIRLKRVYESPAAEDGYRILVDRLWPRGVKKEALDMDLWAKDFTPPSTLRIAYHDGEIDFAHFAKAYRAYLDERSDKAQFLEQLHDILARRAVTLLYAAKQTESNHATVLRDWILENNR